MWQHFYVIFSLRERSVDIQLGRVWGGQLFTSWRICHNYCWGGVGLASVWCPLLHIITSNEYTFLENYLNLIKEKNNCDKRNELYIFLCHNPVSKKWSLKILQICSYITQCIAWRHPSLQYMGSIQQTDRHSLHFIIIILVSAAWWEFNFF